PRPHGQRRRPPQRWRPARRSFASSPPWLIPSPLISPNRVPLRARSGRVGFGSLAAGGTGLYIPTMSETAEPVLFDALLTPHRSLSARGFVILMSLAAVIGFGFGAAFLLMGAWPIFGFCGAEWLLFYICFRLNYRAARLRERVRLTPGLLTVERRDPRGRIQSWSF